MDAQHKKKIAEGKAKAAKVRKMTKAVKRPRKPAECPTRKAAMRTFCLMCMGGDADAATAVRQCTAPSCPLWIYRLGNLDHSALKKEVKTGKFKVAK